jgi:hypothetical protein
LYSESLALYHELGNHSEIPAIIHNQGYVALGTRDSWRHATCSPRACVASTLPGIALAWPRG